jgi:putative nucleotidyltransferase with HDIG domain
MTRQRILFVDDDPLVLQGLQRMLRPLREEWDMGFAAGGEEGLLMMADAPFDVVVSDMRMPGMNGAQFLTEVSRQHPATVRLILSGHADRDLVSQCVGVAHQYISKPCDPEQLRSLVRNACLLSGHLVSPEVKQVVGAIERLPSVPQVYGEIREALKDDDTGPQVLGDIIQKDIGMTAKILKLVNSAFFGLRRTIASPHEAVAYLGMDTIKNLVLAQSIFEGANNLKSELFSLDDLWHHSLTVANGARAIAKAEGQSRLGQEDAFVGGILHDVGVLILATNFPDLYDKAARLVLTEKVLIPTAEQECFGVTHAEVGAYLLGLWGLPSSILKIVSLHHKPFALQEKGYTAVLAVHIADVFCGVGRNHPIFETNRVDLDALAKAGLGARLEPWRNAVIDALGE